MDYVAVSARVTDRLTTDGQQMLLRVKNPGTYDPVAGAYTGGQADADTPFYGVAVNITEEFSKEVNWQNIETQDKLVYGNVPSSFPTPSLDNKVVIAGVEWSIIRKQEINPAGTPVLYIYQVRP